MLLEAIKMIGEIAGELFHGGMPADRLWLLGAAVILVLIQEVLSLWKKGKMKDSEVLVIEVVKALGLSILSVTVIVAIFLFLLSILGQWLPGLGLPAEKDVVVWYAAVTICITVVIQPILHLFILTQQKILRISLFALHMLLLTAALGWIAEFLQPDGLISVQGRLVMGIIMSSVMLVLTILEREMEKKEKEKSSALGIAKQRTECGSG